MKVLVLGGTGFIGSHFVEFFASNPKNSVQATYFQSQPFENSRVEWHQVDLRIPGILNSLIGDQDLVIQAAATTSGMAEIATKVDFHITDNVLMNANILRNVHASKVKHFVFFSCITMLKSSMIPQKESDYSESDAIHPRYFGIGWTKVYIEKLCEHYSRHAEQTKYTVIRHSNVYGPRDKFHPQKSHVLAATINKVMSASTSVQIWGNGQESRDFVYVDDLVELIQLIADKQKENYLLVNCGGSAFLSTTELTDLVIEQSGKTYLKIEYDPNKPTVDFSARVDTTLAFELFGWRPRTSIEKGIQKTINFWKFMKLQEPRWPLV